MINAEIASLYDCNSALIIREDFMQRLPTIPRLVGMTHTLRRTATVALLSTALAAATVGTGASPAMASGSTRLTAAFVGDANWNVTIAKGQSVSMVGHLVDVASNQNLSGYVLSLYARTDSSKPWTNIASDVTDSGGKATQKVTPNYSTQLQWRFAGAGGHAASTSPTLSITIGLPPTRMAGWDEIAPGWTSVVVLKGKPSTYAGYLADSQFGNRIAGATVQLYARGNPTKPWTVLKTLVTDANGKVKQTITPNYDVQLQWRYAGSSVHGPSSSPIQSLVIGLPPTVISITDSTTVTKGSSTPVAGHLYTWQGVHDIAGQTLDLYARGNATKPWVKIKSLVTNSQGKVSQLVTPNYTVQLEWRFAGSSADAATVSRIITITVH